MRELHLTARQRNRLEARRKATPEVGLFRRTLAVLAVADGTTVTAVARLLRTSRVSVHHWVACYAQDDDPTALADHRGGNHPTVGTEDLQAGRSDCLGQSPDRFGFQAVSWTVGLLQQQLAPLCEGGLFTQTIRRPLNDWGYAWKRPRYVLDPDPERSTRATSGTAERLHQDADSAPGRDPIVVAGSSTFSKRRTQTTGELPLG